MNTIRDKLRSPLVICLIYTIASGIVIMIFRFIYPGINPPLLIYSGKWRLVRGLLDYLDLFPALAMSALVIPFGIASFDDDPQSFSKAFFQHLLPSVITAILAAVIYGMIFFLAFPLVKDSEENMKYKGDLYKQAKEQINELKKNNEWTDIARLYVQCENIWPGNPDMASLQTDISINMDKLAAEESAQKNNARAELSALNSDEESYQDYTYKGKFLTAVSAMELGESAYEQQQFYDAHWLATIARRLSADNATMERKALELAGRAWSKIESQAPNQKEEKLYDLYRKKNDGYKAYSSGEYIDAYFIFKELSAVTPDDTDVKYFLALSETATMRMAFFLEEMDMTLGNILTGAVFSLPGYKDRVVMRLGNFSTFRDYAFGMNFEYMKFDSLFQMTASVKAPYVKLLPYTENGVSKVLVLTHALDRTNKNADHDAEWYVGNKPVTGIILDISFEDLLLLSQVRRGLQNMQFTQLFTASKIFGSAGYVAQIFEAEILYRLGAVVFFLPMAIIVIVIGWRFRAKSRPRYIFIPFFGVLPVVFHGFVILYRSVLNTIGIWLVISLGFSAALAICIVFLVVSFFASLIILAAQHS